MLAEAVRRKCEGKQEWIAKIKKHTNISFCAREVIMASNYRQKLHSSASVPSGSSRMFSNKKSPSVQRSARTGRLVVVANKQEQKDRARKLGLNWYL